MSPIESATNLAERFVLTESTLGFASAKGSVGRLSKWFAKRYFLSRISSLRLYLGELASSESIVDSFLADPSEFSRFTSHTPTQKWTSYANLLLLPQDNSSLAPSASLSPISALCSPLMVALVAEFRRAAGPSAQILAIEFQKYLHEIASRFLLPAIAHEANAARIRVESSEQHPEIRYATFVRTLSDDNVRRAFWSKYPVLLRVVSSALSNRTSSSCEMFRRLSEDRKRIEEMFAIPASASVTSIGWGRGDAHRDGQVVSIIWIGIRGLVYKPRSLAVDAAYTDFLAWYGTRAKREPPARLKILNMQDYGYAEYIVHAPANSLAELQTFYHKTGQLVAICWLLGITDLHHENLIASRSEPYITDVEAAFDRPLPDKRSSSRYQYAANMAFADLLFKTGLLPVRFLGEGGVYDISGIGALEVQPAPLRVLTLENAGRDDLVLKLADGSIPLEQNSPFSFEGKSDGTQTESGIRSRRLIDFLPQLLAGFDEAMVILSKFKSDLSAQGELIGMFRTAPMRWVARQTLDYARTIEQMCHPSIAASSIECDMYLAGTLRRYGKMVPHLFELTRSEVESLWKGDIPYFQTNLDSSSLASSNGVNFGSFFSGNGLAAYESRLNSLESSKEIRHDVVAKCVQATVALTNHIVINENAPSVLPSVLSKERLKQLLDLASAIGDRLLSHFHYVNGIPFGVGLSPLKEEQYATSLLPADSYDGIPGIGIFFCHLSRHNPDARYLRFVEHAFSSTHLMITERAGARACGALSGLGSLLYADLHLRRFCRPRSDATYGRVLIRLQQLTAEDTFYDIVSGAAGALIISLRFFAETRDDRALRIAKTAAERLAVTAEQQKCGVAWHTLKIHDRRLGGMAHGVSGVAWALSEYYDHTGDPRWKSLATRAFEYEQSLFDPNLRAWVDGRKGTATCFWCYGAPGIGLAVDGMRSVLGNQTCDQVVSNAQSITWNAGFLANHCLCHGNLGNLEVFRLTNDEDKIRSLFDRVVESYRNTGEWMCGLPAGATTPGLMCGLAGIGLGILRHIDPMNVPNVLKLEL